MPRLGLVEILDLFTELTRIPQSHFLQALNPQNRWKTGEYLQALTVDYLANITYMLHGKGSKPKPIPRPQPLGTPETGLEVAELAAILNAPRRALSPTEQEQIRQREG